LWESDMHEDGESHIQLSTHILHFAPVERFLFHVLFKDFFWSGTIQRFPFDN
jgi:hypothetical protein